MSTTSFSIKDVGGPTMHIEVVGDHYAVVGNGYVVGVITQCEGGWKLEFLDGTTSVWPAPLADAMKQALGWRQPR